MGRARRSGAHLRTPFARTVGRVVFLKYLDIEILARCARLRARAGSTTTLKEEP
ncbi:hypothetical protein B005_2142 [Nocardiopsis alba ATCC BAA-2165]|uniref:Uncharacterized protein n=1 Tax=Nocardiopsis alba (strain ATCC BAA-2165 / BE74) TaxID=1205910 RepID=J7LC68_NOCAA|nr:hypothetical protein B005_2142 [Nocardiopsis alba ATCC BAA-2165]